MNQVVRPALNGFMAGYPGPVENQFRGGSITVVAVLVYEDGIRIEWRMARRPDLSWMDGVTMESKPELPKEVSGPGFAHALLGSERLRELWGRATLSDGWGREAELSFERSGPLDLHGGSEGTATCRCEPPTDSKALTLRFGGADIVVPLTSHQRRQHGRSSLFQAGYPGPKNPIPFLDGAIKLISTLVYEDRIRIEWLADPVPDLSWLFKDNPSDYLMPQIADEEQRLITARGRMNFKRTFALWMGARLTDNLRTPYVGSLGNSGVSRTGFKGEVHFTPSAPPEARELNLVLYDLSVFIPLASL